MKYTFDKTAHLKILKSRFFKVVRVRMHIGTSCFLVIISTFRYQFINSDQLKFVELNMYNDHTDN